MHFTNYLFITIALVIGLPNTGKSGESAPIYQPGAPGKAARVLSVAEAIEVADTRYTVGDA